MLVWLHKAFKSLFKIKSYLISGSIIKKWKKALLTQKTGNLRASWAFREGIMSSKSKKTVILLLLPFYLTESRLLHVSLKVTVVPLSPRLLPTWRSLSGHHYSVCFHRAHIDSLTQLGQTRVMFLFSLIWFGPDPHSVSFPFVWFGPDSHSLSSLSAMPSCTCPTCRQGIYFVFFFLKQNN